jgi:hypothetical protein
MRKLGDLSSYEPTLWTPRWDADGLVGLLGIARGKTYELVDQPDETSRNVVAPDFLYLDRKSDDQIAIEHFRWIPASEREVASLVMKGIEPKPISKERLLADGLRYVHAVPEGLGVISGWDGDESVAHLEREIVRKLDRDQLGSFASAEKLLFINCGILLPERTCEAVIVNVPEDIRERIDGCFLISDYKSVWQVW